MLTEPDNTRQGKDRDRKNAKAGTENEELVSFLNEFKEKSKRDIKHLKSFFAKRSIETEIYYGKDKYFSHEKRKEYFEQIAQKADELLSKSLVLVDPDTGLEVDKSGKEHILYSEVKTLYDRMDRSSVLMVFQWISRFENIDKYFCVIPEMLRDKIKSDLPILVSDGKVVFYFLTRENKSLRELLGKEISKYKDTYPELRIGKLQGF